MHYIFKWLKMEELMMKKVLVGVLGVLLVVLIGIGGYIYKLIDAISKLKN